MILKQKLSELISKIRNSLRAFPITIISIMLLTLIYAINLNNNFLSSSLLIRISLLLLTFAVATFFIETLSKTKPNVKKISYIISAVIACIFTYLIVDVNKGILGMTYDVFEFRIARLFYCYLLILFTLSIYFNYRNSEITFNQYLTNVFINAFKITLIYGIFAIGIAAVLGIFIFLILDGSSYMLIARVELLLLGCYYIPAFLYSFYNQENVGKFGKAIIKYVLDTLVIAAFIVIYMYIIKIIILRDMPSNQIFRILTALFVIGMPTWTMTMFFDEDKFLDKINKKLPLLFIPFIFLQAYSIGIRIFENGITPLRYICLMLIIFEVIYIGIYLKNKEKIGNILLIFAIMTIISGFIPYINMFYISDISQYNRFKENYYDKSEEYTEEEKNNIYSSYKYLMHNSVEGYKYLDNLTEDEKKQISEIKAKTITTTAYEYLYGSKIIEYIDVEDYKSLYKIETNDYNGNIEFDEFSKLTFELQQPNGNTSQIEIDLSKLIYLYMINTNDFSEFFEANNELQLDNDRKLILTSISLKYDYETEEINYYNISGYLLEK